MNEQDDTPSEQPTGAKRDAIGINDFVFAATGARVRRLALPDGEHWFQRLHQARVRPVQEMGPSGVFA
ncbi:hypothetical protein [Streptomyces flaveolus]|uniref:hypothetical protein n=1 Tax=Streptomyces flaveolus TaxID=67297 RepID=UPI003F543F29